VANSDDATETSTPATQAPIVPGLIEVRTSKNVHVRVASDQHAVREVFPRPDRRRRPSNTMMSAFTCTYHQPLQRQDCCAIQVICLYRTRKPSMVEVPEGLVGRVSEAKLA
jgi:hypothetical protein